jgi:hypothetical protein
MESGFTGGPGDQEELSYLLNSWPSCKNSRYKLPIAYPSGMSRELTTYFPPNSRTAFTSIRVFG